MPHKFAFNGDFLYVATPLAEMRYHWGYFNAFKEDRDFLSLFVARGLVSIPKAIWNEEELEAIRRNLWAKAMSRKRWLRERGAEQVV